MKRLIQGVIFILLYSCQMNSVGEIPANQLEKQFEKDVVRKDFVSRVIEFADHSRDSCGYFIAYDSKDKIVNNNSEYYEYDLRGRIAKKYVCHLERDPDCKHPYVFTYEYDGKNLKSIKRQTTFGNDSAAHIFETFEYDLADRLIKHTSLNYDTTVYFYRGKDTLKSKQIWSTWLNDADDKWVRTTRETTFAYDNFGRMVSTSWTEGEISMRNDFTYDKQARLVMTRDTLLSDFNREPNSCCILYWTEMKYDDRSRVVEEIHSSGSFEDPSPNFQWRKKYEYSDGLGVN
jgi:hypothetical protein